MNGILVWVRAEDNPTGFTDDWGTVLQRDYSGSMLTNFSEERES